MMDYLGESEFALKLSKLVIDLRTHLPNPNNNKQAAALMVLANLTDPTETNKKILAVDGAHRLSTFLGFYVLQARSVAGDQEGTLESAIEYWGTMLDYGATTFWEDFDLNWILNSGRIDEIASEGMNDLHGDFGKYCYPGYRKSLSHGWASGVTAWLSKFVLGINVVEPGFKRVQVLPLLGSLDFVEGTVPSPLGILKIRHEKQVDGSVRTFLLNVPRGMIVDILQ
jgi:hypothetical protein